MFLPRDTDFSRSGSEREPMIHIEGSLGFLYDHRSKTLHVRLIPNLHSSTPGGARIAISAKPDHSTARNKAWRARQKGNNV